MKKALILCVLFLSMFPLSMALEDYEFVTMWGSCGSGDYQFGVDLGPRGLVADNAGKLYVADYGNQKIKGFSTSGTFEYSFAPGYVGDIDYANGYLYFSKSYGYACKYTVTSTKVWEKYFSAPGWNLGGPCVDSDGNVHFTNGYYNKVYKLDSNTGNLIKEYSVPEGAGHIASDNYGHVYIASGYGPVQRYTNDGVYDNSRLNLPSEERAEGIDVDNQGSIFIATLNHKMRKYDANWNLLAEWGEEGTGPGQFSGPGGVAVDNQGYVYVSDGGGANCAGMNRRIQVFRPSDAPPQVDLEIKRLLFNSISRSWGDAYTEEYPQTDKEFILAQVYNSGPATAQNVMVEFLIDDVSIGETSIEEIRPDESELCEILWDLESYPCENCEVSGWVDPENLIPEESETNNIHTQSISIYYAVTPLTNPPPNRCFDLRTDAYGQFNNWGLDFSDLEDLWSTQVASWGGWDSFDQMILRTVFPIWAVVVAKGGHCYGMASTAILYFADPTLKPIGRTGTPTFDFPKEFDVVRNIKRYHSMQFLEALYLKALELGWEPNFQTQVDNILTSLQGKDPCIIEYPPHIDYPAHAVTAYKIVDLGRYKDVSIYDNRDSLGPGHRHIHSKIMRFYIQEELWIMGTEEPHGYNLEGGDKFLAFPPRMAFSDLSKHLLYELFYLFLQFIKEMDKTRIEIACPVTTLISDQFGRRIGFEDTVLVKEIPGAELEFVDGIYIYDLPVNYLYYLKCTGIDSGSMDITIITPVDDTTTKLVQFTGVFVRQGLQTFLPYDFLKTDFSIDIDHEGDGVADETKKADIIKILKKQGTPGSISGTVSDSIGGLLGIAVDLFDSAGSLAQFAFPDVAGFFEFDSVAPGEYTISIVTPLGYRADLESKVTNVRASWESIVNFTLRKQEMAESQRSAGYWKHQVNVHLSGKGHAQESLADMSNYMNLIREHFNNNLANPVTIFEVSQPADQTDSLEALQELLTVKGNAGMNAKARQQMIALLLNVVSLKLHQTTPVSEDSATVSQAITYCNQLITDSEDTNDEVAKDIADQINNGVLVASGVIPLTTPEIAYKGTEDQIAQTSNLPNEFSLEQSYPNPFNPMCEIAYTLPTDCEVKLTIYNILGQKVRVLVDEQQSAGRKSVKWDSRDEQGQEVTSGIYIYRMQAGDFAQSKRMVLLK